MFGDPKLYIGENGGYLYFKSGQPYMEQGYANVVVISLFTRRDWCGNVLQPEAIGSDFEEALGLPISFQTLNLIRDAAEKALQDAGFPQVNVTVNNPVSHRVEVQIVIKDSTGTVYGLSVVRGGSPSEITPSPSLPSNLLTYDGEPVTYLGEYIIYTP